MKRLPNWESRLMRWLRDAESRPFIWGEWDCALAAADGVLAITGEDLSADFREGYSTANEAAAILQQAGFTTLSDVADERVGNRLDSPLFAQRGDLVAAEIENGLTLLVCVGAVAVGPGGKGLIRVPMKRWQSGWRV